MPRSTAKSRKNVDGNSTTKKIEHPQDSKQTTVRRNAWESTTEQVFHRKSDRRRVARDIFLVFEEEPSTRRTRGSNKKTSKPKFGHLKVEDLIKPKNLLRDIKNEPKCYLSSNTIEKVNASVQKTAKKRTVNSLVNSPFNVWPTATCTLQSDPNTVPQKSNTPIGDVYHVAKVNPIFLWAKQDNTRIIEVRCEDYDKRNRIRLTKTTNGWRAIPRSDPTTSKVFNFYSTPLIKVKRENQNSLNNISANFCHANADNKLKIVETEILNQTDSCGADMKINGIGHIKISKKTKKKKSKKRDSLNCKKTEGKMNASKINDNATMSSYVVTNEYKGNYNQEDEDKFDNKNSKNNVIIPPTCNQNHLVTGRNTDSDDVLLKAAYQNSDEDDCSFQLCPKTGLFLRCSHNNVGNNDIEIVEFYLNNKTSTSDEKVVVETKNNSIDENNESLEAKTKNLKDLLDDADLFQHCDDNANSDSDLIDTLVKSSCENNLIQDSENAVICTEDNLVNKDMSSTSNELVNEPPKCLSFNEAGEIEALNCELFQPNEYIDSFEKQPSTIITGAHDGADIQSQNTSNVVITSVASNDKYGNTNESNVDEIPKDLSYKKREEVCPPSESRSQCAVTSSSDVINPPNLDDTSVLTSSTETIKTLILEQFIKMNTISGHKAAPIEIEKPIDITHMNAMYSKSSEPSNVIETVVIEDDDSVSDKTQFENSDEPMRKRLRSNVTKNQNVANDDYKVAQKIVMIDKDPDPLTQLQLLIRNSQWKVPDPILVPKDRLSAVLASPAREIPLLITTRPELRLPEAFAYPEIIQNPNILVISMAQLEAILKNEMDKNKTKEIDVNKLSPNYRINSGINLKYGSEFSVNNQTQGVPDIGVECYTNQAFLGPSSIKKSTSTIDENAKYAHIGNGLSSDINAATMAVLNQMLWLPYIGQISQELITSVKSSKNTPSNIPKVGCIQSKHSTSTDNTTLSGLFANAALSSMLKQGKQEVTLFQKILQHQMQNVLNLSQLSNNQADGSGTNNSADSSKDEQNSNFLLINSNVSESESPNTKNRTTVTNHQESEQGNVLGGSGKTYNLRSSTMSRESSEQFSNKRSNTEKKPRLTCKSLSNLLEPDHHQTQNISVMDSAMAPTSHVSNVQIQYAKKNNEARGVGLLNNMAHIESGQVEMLNSTVRQNSTSNFETNDYNKQKFKPSDNIALENVARSTDIPTNELNVPLWHPLFGSNSKTAYSSPWQWTTVTAAGE
ncbi:uncharacterized protein LOC142236750 [Haematobia irritans]|uniref:uncharacterized protein LOC142236750 n=1 Tax=Haematobia irritans TaxID=7368 RepID=UPI003F507488